MKNTVSKICDLDFFWNDTKFSRLICNVILICLDICYIYNWLGCLYNLLQPITTNISPTLLFGVIFLGLIVVVHFVLVVLPLTVYTKVNLISVQLALFCIYMTRRNVVIRSWSLLVFTGVNATLLVFSFVILLSITYVVYKRYKARHLDSNNLYPFKTYIPFIIAYAGVFSMWILDSVVRCLVDTGYITVFA